MWFFIGLGFVIGAAYWLSQSYTSWEKDLTALYKHQKQKPYHNGLGGGLFPIKLFDHADRRSIPRGPPLAKRDDLPPIVIIPGLGGSRLAWKGQKRFSNSILCSSESNHWTPLWFSVESLVPVLNTCWDDNMMPVYDSAKNEWANCPDLEIEAVDFGVTKGFDTLFSIAGVKQWSVTYFQNFTNLLRRSYGYRDSVNLFGAPYDWRLNLSPSYRKAFHGRLQTLIEKAFAQNKNQKVWLISHSMGCPTTQYFLCKFVSEQWKDKHIAGFVPIAAPWGGSPRAAEAMMSGVHFPILSREKLRNLTQTMSGPAWMLPDPDIFSLPKSVYVHEKGFSYRNQDMEILLQLASMKPEFIRGIKTHVFNSRSSMYQAPNVPTYAVCGVCRDVKVDNGEGEGMALGLVYADGMEEDVTHHINETAYYQRMRDEPKCKNSIVNKIDKPVYEMIGDFTVPYISMMLPKYYWKQSKPLEIKEFVGGAHYSHGNILDQPDVVQYIIGLVLG